MVHRKTKFYRKDINPELHAIECGLNLQTSGQFAHFGDSTLATLFASFGRNSHVTGSINNRHLPQMNKRKNFAVAMVNGQARPM